MMQREDSLFAPTVIAEYVGNIIFVFDLIYSE